MIFNSFWFMAFAMVFFVQFYLLRSPRFRLYSLIAFCTVFHFHFAGPAGVLPIVVLGLATYAAGRWGNRRAIYLVITLVVASLVFYKYLDFLIKEICQYLPPWIAAWQNSVKTLHPSLPPLAISFFAFEFVHYLVDVSHGKNPLRKGADFILFSIFWPSLVAGPVKRYEQFIPALHRGLRSTHARDFSLGLLRVCCGYGKKLISDSLTAWTRDQEAIYNLLGTETRWLFFFALAMRIYLDFSGYSDMAIGFARMMGIRLPENFRWPYLATNLVDFWHRWHISLSTWIRDYIYIPLGGNRSGPARRSLNILAAFALCGLWHGAAWNFMLWGLYHGLGLLIVHATSPLTQLFRARIQQGGSWKGPTLIFWNIAGCLGTNLFVWSGWLLFFYPADKAFLFFRGLFPFVWQ